METENTTPKIQAQIRIKLDNTKQAHQGQSITTKASSDQNVSEVRDHHTTSSPGSGATRNNQKREREYGDDGNGNSC